MRRQHRDRHVISLDRKRHLADLAETRPTSGAVRAFNRRAYECSDVLGYMAKKYDIEREIGIGEKGIRSDKGLP